MKTTSLVALAAVLVLSTAAPSSARPPTKGPARGAKAAPAAERLDIHQWPIYQGAELVQQVSLSGSQLKELASQVPPEAQPHLRGLRHVAVLGYRLPPTAVLKEVIAFYEPRVLAAGYKILAKDLADPDDASAVYAGPKENILVLSVESEGEGGRMLEIISVEGPIASLASMGEVMKTAGSRRPKPAPGTR